MKNKLEGNKGKGGGNQRAPQEAPNSLVSTTTILLLELLGEGPIVGFPHASNPGQDIFINDVPVQNEDGSYNFTPAPIIDWRIGNPTQPHMQGFPSASNQVPVSVPVLFDTPVIKSVSDASIDNVDIVIQLPNGLNIRDTSNGDLNGTSVNFAIDRKLNSSGVWENVNNIQITGKTTTAYQEAYNVLRPSGLESIWSVRVRKYTADSTSQTLVNNMVFSFMVENQDVKLSYPDSAYVGIGIDAAAVGNQIPRRSYLIKGLICSIPSNYNAEAGTYSGQWDGTFTTGWTDNPAWCLYDALTRVYRSYDNEDNLIHEYQYIKPEQVDKFSFYDAGVYNDERVPSGYMQETERRFTFNTPIAASDDILKFAMNIAGMMNATIVDVGGFIALNQDRPRAPERIISNSDVINGMFEYSSSNIASRTTSVNVSYQDKSDLKYLGRVVSEWDNDGISKYGFNKTDIIAYGATTEGQALRAARYVLYTNLYQNEVVNFTVGFNNLDVNLGAVFKLYDEDYLVRAGAGRVISATLNTITFDKEIEFAANSQVDVMSADGYTIQTRTISSITNNTAIITPNWNTTPLIGADYQVTTPAVQARLFKITSVIEDETNSHQAKIEAITYDPNKFEYIDGIAGLVPPLVYPVIDARVIGNVKNLQVQPIGFVDAERIHRSLLVTWDLPDVGIPYFYNLKWRRNSGNYTVVENISIRNYEIENTFNGIYDITVYAVTLLGQRSSGENLTYTLDLSDGTGSALSPVTNLQVVGGGLTFSGKDLYIQWVNPNDNVGTTFKDFIIDIFDPVSGNKIRTIYTTATTYTYYIDDNIGDGGPFRTVRIEVYCRDILNKTSTSNVKTFTNPAPEIPNNIVISGFIEGAKITFESNLEPDIKGYLIWRSETSGFAPSVSNLIYDGNDNYISDTGLATQTIYYYKIASYDTFIPLGSAGATLKGNGTGLNISGQFAVTTAPPIGIASGDVLPVDAEEGDNFILTLDGKLYVYHNGAWVAPGINSGTVLPAGVEGDLFFNTVDGKLYRYHNDAWTAAIAATDIDGQLTTTQITPNSITSDLLAANSVIAGKVSAGSIGTTELAAQAVTAAKITAGTITSTLMAANSVVATAIAAGAVTADKINVSALSAITGNIGTITTGIIYNATQSSYMNMNAVDSGSYFMYLTGGNFWLRGDGVANLHGAYITDATITNAKIGNAQVGTLSIAGNAIISSIYAENSGTTQSSGIRASVTLANYPSNASGVIIFASISVSGQANGHITVQILRNGNVITSRSAMYVAGLTSPHLVTGFDNPGAGSHTYEVGIVSGGTSFSSTFASITVMGGKR